MEMMNERYERQILLKEFGEAGQLKLQQSKVLVIGAGGLGCPALQYLVAAGVGTIGIVDGDIVQLSNLHRQTLYDTADVGKMKAIIAREKLQQKNPGCQIISYTNYLYPNNAWNIIALYDMVIDGSDNFSTRYLVNDVCTLQRKPLIYAAIYKYEGQLAVFNVFGEDEVMTSYRDLFPEPPLPGSVPGCNTAGVLGVLPGVIGTMQATEAIKLITGIGKPLINQLLTYNLLSHESMVLAIEACKNKPYTAPTSKEAIEQFDYNVTCDTPNSLDEFEIGMDVFEQMLADPFTQVVDVREWNEEPVITAFAHIQIPLSDLMQQPDKSLGTKVIFVCQSGIRSKQAVNWAKQQGYINKAYSLKGGLKNWLNHQSMKTKLHGT